MPRSGIAETHPTLVGCGSFIAQELNAHQFDLYFYNSHRLGELDFVIEKDLSIIPIEVKSGKDYYVHSAITKVTDNPEYEIKESIVFANCNIHFESENQVSSGIHGDVLI